MFDKENIEDYRKMLDYSMKQEKIIRDPASFKAVDGSYHAKMEEVEQYNNAYWQYKNLFIIDKDSELFSAPLSQEIFDRIVSSPSYRTLIDILEEKVKSQHRGEDVSNGMKR